MSHARILLVVVAAGTFWGQQAVKAQDPVNEDPKQRIKTARSLAKEGSSAIERLRPYQSDKAVEVRRAAVESIVTIGGPQTLEPLTYSLKDGDGDVQRLAANGLVNFYVPGYYQTGWRGRLKRTAGDVWERVGGSDEPVVPSYVEVRPEIITGLGEVVSGSVSMETRATAARALGILRGRAATDQLVQALLTKNSDVMYEVLIAFEKIRNPEVAPRLFYLLRDPDEKVQVAALETVSLLRNKDALEPLREAWSRARSNRIRRSVLESIAMLADEKDRSLFESHLSSEDEYLRAAASEGIGRLGKKDDLARMTTLFEAERKMRPRLSQAFAVVRLGNREQSEFSPLQYLINTLNNKGWRGVAQGFLKDLSTDPAIRSILHNTLSSGTRDERTAIIGFLGETGGKDSVEPLDALTRDPDKEVALQAAEALRVLRARVP